MEENSLTVAYSGLYGIAFAASMLGFLMTSMHKLRFLIVLSSHMARKLPESSEHRESSDSPVIETG